MVDWDPEGQTVWVEEDDEEAAEAPEFGPLLTGDEFPDWLKNG